MAPAFAKVSSPGNPNTTVSNKRLRVVDVTLDNSYPTGGYAITPAQLGFKVRIETVFDATAKNAAGTSAVPCRWDPANQKLQCYRYDGASAGKAFLEEVVNAVDLSTFTVRLTALGA
jgi:hypothetical protein